MRRLSLVLPLSLFCVGAAQPPADQQQQPPPQETPAPPIIVTGAPLTVLTVDYQRVARECAECRRALTQLRQVSDHANRMDLTQLSTDTLARRFQPRRSREEPGSIGRELQGLRKENERDERQAIRTQARQDRVPVIRSSASFLAQLERQIAPIVGALQTEHQATLVVDSGVTTIPEARRLDVTDEVIRRLDGTAFQIAVTEAPAPAPQP